MMGKNGMFSNLMTEKKKSLFFYNFFVSLEVNEKLYRNFYNYKKADINIFI